MISQSSMAVVQCWGNDCRMLVARTTLMLVADMSLVLAPLPDLIL
jgi:hypothetical protein